MGIKQVEIQAKDKKPVCHNNALTIKHLSLRGHDEFPIALVTFKIHSWLCKWVWNPSLTYRTKVVWPRMTRSSRQIQLTLTTNAQSSRLRNCLPNSNPHAWGIVYHTIPICEPFHFSPSNNDDTLNNTYTIRVVEVHHFHIQGLTQRSGNTI